MEIIAFIFALCALAYIESCNSKIKILEKRIDLIRRHVNIDDIDMLSDETKDLITNKDDDTVNKVIRKELGITREDAASIIENIKSGH